MKIKPEYIFPLALIALDLCAAAVYAVQLESKGEKKYLDYQIAERALEEKINHEQ